VRGPISGRVVAWTGDGNNMACTWIQAAARFNFELRVACPRTLMPPESSFEWAKRERARVFAIEDPEEAVAGADCVVTDTWVSLGFEPEDHRHNLLASYRVDDRLMKRAKPDAIFMHCLPAHRDEEVTASVIDGPQSVVWQEAENRMHAQKGILSWCLNKL
jgi:ornithine carbamoyltransferase